MALVYSALAPDPRAPAVHALVIGVGGYPHLRDGCGAMLPGLRNFGMIGQLTSPPRSALAWRTMLVGTKTEWYRPLGSIELLVSPAGMAVDPTFDGGGDLEPATWNAIQGAFDRWWDRCNACPENIALFVFIGHGLQVAHSLLLASDFGDHGRNPWVKAIDIDVTMDAFRSNRATTQVFVLDTCRSRPAGLTRDIFVPPLREPEAGAPRHAQVELTLRATTGSSEAYGPEYEPSYLTKAALAGLAGASAAKEQRRGWWVGTERLGGSMSVLMPMVGAPDAQTVCVENTGNGLLRSVQAPLARLCFGCDPQEANAVAELSWHHKAQQSRTRPNPLLKDWQLDEVPVGPSRIAADFPNGEYLNDAIDIVVIPPVSVETIAVATL